MDKLNNFENVLMVLNTYIGLQNIKDLMGVIILVFQFVLLLIKIILLVKEKIKNKKYNEIDDVVKDNLDELGDLLSRVDEYIGEEDERNK